MLRKSYSAILKQPDMLAFVFCIVTSITNIILVRFFIAFTFASEEATLHLFLLANLYYLAYIFTASYSGQLFERFDKNKLFLVYRVLELVYIILALIGVIYSLDTLLLIVSALMMIQLVLNAAIMNGVLPDIFHTDELSRASALMLSASLVGFFLGFTAGQYFYYNHQPFVAFGILIVLSISGIGSCYFLKLPGAAKQKEKFSWDPFSKIFATFDTLTEQKMMYYVLSYLFAFTVLIFLLLMFVSNDELTLWQSAYLAEDRVVYIIQVIGLSMLVGCLISGRISGEQIESGLIPLSMLIISVSFLWLSLHLNEGFCNEVAVLIIGFCVGILIVPTQARLLSLTQPGKRGLVIMVALLIVNVGLTVMQAAFWTVVIPHNQHQPSELLFYVGLVVFVIAAIQVRSAPDIVIRSLLWLINHTIYRLTIVGHEHIPRKGPALVVCNHVSFVDSFIVSGAIPRLIRYMIFKPIYENRLLNWLFRMVHCIPVDGRDKESVTTALHTAREELKRGHIVCIFAEGGITRTGQLLPFRTGLERIANGLDIPVIAVHLDGLRDSIFSCRGGDVGFRFPKKLPVPVTISFSEPMDASSKAWQVRQRVQELACKAQLTRVNSERSLGFSLIKNLRRYGRKRCFIDTCDNEVTRNQFLVNMLRLSARFKERYHHGEEVGVLLPNTVDSIYVNTALTCAGVIPVNVPPEANDAHLDQIIARGNLSTLITDKEYLGRLDIKWRDIMVDVNDVLIKAGTLSRVTTKLFLMCLPTALCLKLYGRKASVDTPSAVVFYPDIATELKGVVLSHKSVLANVSSIRQLFDFRSDETLLQSLSVSNAFGFTLGMWLPLLENLSLSLVDDIHNIEQLTGSLKEQPVHYVLATEAFFNVCNDHVSKELLSELKIAIHGVVPCSLSIQEAFQDKFGVSLLEGYGITELGPGISINIPDYVEKSTVQTGTKSGSIGHPLPGVAVKVIDNQTKKALVANQPGRLLIKSEGQMLQYWHEPDTKLPNESSWYDSQVMASIDDDGFIFFK